MAFQEAIDALALYGDLLKDGTNLLDNSISIPEVKESDLEEIIHGATNFLRFEPTLLKLNSPLVIVGDIHGNIRDMMRIIQKNGSPKNTKYLFMGDYIDRGEYSVEVITLLFSLKVCFPKNIQILRGNHECDHVNETYGFKSECLNKFGDLKIYNLCQKAFDEMSLAAIVDEKIFCVHGGISSNISRVEVIQAISKPINIRSPKKVHDISEGLLWSDPDDSVQYFDKSYRGKGQIFGKSAANVFLTENNLNVMVRAHSCVADGFTIDFDKQVYTVFSSGYYHIDNKPGYLLVDSGSIKAENLVAVPQLKRRIHNSSSLHCCNDSSLPPLSHCTREEFLEHQKKEYARRRAMMELSKPRFPLLKTQNHSGPVFHGFGLY